MKEIGFAKSIFEKAKALNDAGPAPVGVARGQHIDLQYVARLGSLDPDGPSERVNAAAVDGQVFLGGHPGPHLAAARVHALNLHLISRLNAQTRRKGSVPHGMGGFGRQDVLAHDSFTLTLI